MRYGLYWAAAILALVTGGCASTDITYSYDPAFSFSDARTYAWAGPKAVGGNSLVDSNVRFVADNQLQARGFTLSTDRPALVAWVGYEPCMACFDGPLDLRVLTLNIARGDDRQM